MATGRRWHRWWCLSGSTWILIWISRVVIPAQNILYCVWWHFISPFPASDIPKDRHKKNQPKHWADFMNNCWEPYFHSLIKLHVSVMVFVWVLNANHGPVKDIIGDKIYNNSLGVIIGHPEIVCGSMSLRIFYSKLKLNLEFLLCNSNPDYFITKIFYKCHSTTVVMLCERFWINQFGWEQFGWEQTKF